ncbi:MAG: hypothetical protein PSV35_03600 [bacterium]|nr:hypothetical protein [bacterium]
MSNLKTLEKVSGYLFFAGAIVAKIRYLPLTIVSSIVTLASLALYLAAYASWFFASHFYPEHKKHAHEWYGFAQFKEQHILAAALGIVATALSIAGIFLPVLLIPAAWLFLASNVVWTISEYHKLNNPHPQDQDYSPTYQNSYVSYAIAMTSLALVAALSTTLIFIFPLFTIPLIVLTTVFTIGLGVLAAESLLDCNFGDHKKVGIVAEHSNDKVTQVLGLSVTPKEKQTTAPYHNISIFKTPTKNEIESTPSIRLSTITCSVP